jgi:hypothetical protein
VEARERKIKVKERMGYILSLEWNNGFYVENSVMLLRSARLVRSFIFTMFSETV